MGSCSVWSTIKNQDEASLFLLMINDLKVTDMPIWKFVDDATVCEVVPKCFPSGVHQGVKTVENWSVKDKLQLNPDN